MKSSLHHALFLCAVALFATSAKAEDDLLARIVSDPTEQAHVIEAAQKTVVMVRNPCDSAQYSIMPQAVVYAPLKLGADDKLASGAWKQMVTEKGCGQERTLNIFLGVDAARALHLTSMLPGSTHADMILQRDAGHYAATAANLPRKECDLGYISDTQFLKVVGETLSGAKGPPWDELWTLEACDRQAKVTMHFIPDRTGTTIAASASETKFIPLAANTK